MKNNKTNILLFSVLFFLILGLCILRISKSHKFNYYKLNDSFYLHKLDYFSSYSISTVKNNEYQDVIKGVQGIVINQDKVSICFMDEGIIQYATLNKDSIIYNQVNDFNFMKPWKMVEQITLNSNYKLLNQILIISIITLGFFLTIKIFNIKRIDKKKIAQML